MLASRGTVYHTRKSAGEFKHFHRHCDCKVVPGFEDDPDAELVEGVRPEELRDQLAQFKDIDEDELAVSVNGAGDVEVSGKAGKARFSVAGAGDIDALGLDVQDVETHKTGIASIKLKKR